MALEWMVVPKPQALTESILSLLSRKPNQRQRVPDLQQLLRRLYTILLRLLLQLLERKAGLCCRAREARGREALCVCVSSPSRKQLVIRWLPQPAIYYFDGRVSITQQNPRGAFSSCLLLQATGSFSQLFSTLATTSLSFLFSSLFLAG